MCKETQQDPTRSAHFGPPAATGIILDADLVASIIEPWREIAGRLALACIADVGDFREEVLRDYRKMLEEVGE